MRNWRSGDQMGREAILVLLGKTRHPTLFQSSRVPDEAECGSCLAAIKAERWGRVSAVQKGGNLLYCYCKLITNIDQLIYC